MMVRQIRGQQTGCLFTYALRQKQSQETKVFYLGIVEKRMEITKMGLWGSGFEGFGLRAIIQH